MEKAVLKTLTYADIFEFPLTIFEIHKWLIGKKSNLRQVEVAVERLVKEGRILAKNGFYFLSETKKRGQSTHFLTGKSLIVRKRIQRARQSKLYFRKACFISQFLKVIPWIKLIGISGGLSMENAGKMDDIDLFIITKKGKLWVSRLLTLGMLELTGLRRKASDTKKQAAGKICCNLILEEDYMEQSKKNLFIAHEVLQMKVLWQRGDTYHQFLIANEWAFKYLPNWVSHLSSHWREGSRSLWLVDWIPASAVTVLEKWARSFELKVMRKPAGQERVEKGALYFHPIDYGKEILEKYYLGLKNFVTY